MKRVILHVGPSKTGTTTIQALLSEHTNLLLKHGVFYPNTIPSSNEGHPSLALEVRTASGEIAHPTTTPVCSWDEAINAFENSGATSLLVSSEDFSDLDFHHWKWIGKKLEAYEIWIVLALRNPADVVFSAWKQSVKWGFGSGEQVLHFDDAADLLMSLRRVEIFRLTDCIENALKPFKICIFTIERDMSPVDLYQRFSSSANLPDIIANISIQSISRSFNKSLSDWKTMLLLQLNQAFFAHSPKKMTFPENIDAKRLQLRSYMLETLDDTPDVPEFKMAINNDTKVKLNILQQRIIEWAGRKEICGKLSDISESVLLKRTSVSTSDSDGAQPTSVEVIDLLYKSLHNQVEVLTRMRDRANEYGSSQSKQVTKLVADIQRLEGRLSDLASTLEVANKFGETQSAHLLSLKKVATGLESQIVDLARTLKIANNYGSVQSKNVCDLIGILAEKDRQIVELETRLKTNT